ncbi:hypothetical protein F2Q70_00006060 [Brassica cretica]|uniref:Trichome birefringence-like N-terminal domain-containing protein n=1 Tax=Brassica cretica TaxID=69181 RepID=A0A8S9IW90_BRACR|nr:hypothetical protein F2Q70_00006060 [Brassica cretica]
MCPIPVPHDNTLSRHQHSSSLQSPSPVYGPIPAPLSSSPVTTSTSRTQIRDDEQRCDLFNGEWIPNDESPYYNMTCWAIQEHQNCMQFGRPDTGFMRWRWKPDGCDLPIFDPNEFLEMVRGKSMGFVGDSISRNQVQSLLCLLSRVEYPEDISSSPDIAFKGGDCARTRPYRRNETIPEVSDLKIHDIQLEEFRAAEEGMKKKMGLRLRLMNTTQAMLLRPDGHPGRYGHLQTEEVSSRNDCIHWCLPGPIDSWNDILLQMMKTEK